MKIPPGYTPFKPTHYQKLNNTRLKASDVMDKIVTGHFDSVYGALVNGYKVFISSKSHGFLSLLSPYQRMAISRKISGLSAIPRPGDASLQKGSTDIYAMAEKSTGFIISYKVLGKHVYIIEIVANASLKGAKRELPGLYKVIMQGRGPAKIAKVGSIETVHAAVNGQSNELEKAQDLMRKHVSWSFRDDNPKEYTLFHNPSDGMFWDTYESSQDKKQKTTAVAKQFREALVSVQQGDHSVKWVAHSQGGLIFTEATRYHLINGGGDLSKNSVQFNAGANNEQKTNPIMKMAGIKVYGYNNHPFDPVPNIIGGNAKDWVSVAGSLVGFAFALWGGPEKSPHTLPYKGNSAVVQKVYNVKEKTALGVQAIVNSLPF